MVAKKRIVKFDNDKTIKIKILVKNWREDYSPTGSPFLLVRGSYEWVDGVFMDVSVIYKKNHVRMAGELIENDYVLVFGKYFTKLNQDKKKIMIIDAEFISREKETDEE